MVHLIVVKSNRVKAVASYLYLQWLPSDTVLLSLYSYVLKKGKFGKVP